MNGALPLRGVVVSVRGTVLDVQFETALPPIGAAIVCHGEGRTLTAEVTGHSGATTLRAIAIESTRGLRRGDPVQSDGQPLCVPVGPGLLGRVIDLRGRPLDGGPPLEAEGSLPLRRAPPPAAERRATAQLYETGIK